MDFLSLIGTVLTGGATGIIGSLITKGIGLFEAHQKRQDRILDFEHELKLLDKQAALRMQESENELLIAQAEAAANLREASYAHDASAGRAHTWVVDILRLVRPVLTLFLIGLVGTFYVMHVEQRAEITASILYMASSAVLWWYGDRSLTTKK